MKIYLSNYVSSGIFFQLSDDELLYPIAFFAKNQNPANCNYEIYNKELLAIIRCFEQWKPKLKGTEVLIKVITDHKSLEFFIINKKLTRR